MAGWLGTTGARPAFSFGAGSPTLVTILCALATLSCQTGTDAPAGDTAWAPFAPAAPGEARAQVVHEPVALIGGVSGEGRVGDIRIDNAQVAFIIQGVRVGNGYVPNGGGVIDADLVRDASHPGRDVIDEAGSLIGLGHLFEPTSVVVVDAGGPDRPAVVEARGKTVELDALEGELDADFITAIDVDIVQRYTLAPESHLLKMETEITWHGNSTNFQIFDLLAASADVAEAWLPGRGLGESGPVGAWRGAVGRRDEVALGLFPEAEAFVESPIADLLPSLIDGAIVATTPAKPMSDGETARWTRYLGVGEDLAGLVAEWETGRGTALTAYTGQVTDDAGPVAGARVALLDAEGAPGPLTVTDAQGRFSVNLPAGAWDAVPVARRRAEKVDLPDREAWYGAFTADHWRDLAVAALADHRSDGASADGRGVGAAVRLTAGSEAALRLDEPATVQLSVADGGPALFRFERLDPAPSTDTRLAPGVDAARAAECYVLDGAGTFPVEPGRYRVVAHRGLRHEPVVSEITLAAGATETLAVTLPVAWYLPGVLGLDPHAHASPSMDASIPMHHRLAVHAANGVDVHLGTDHDVVADYRPMIAPLGLDGRLKSVVASEVSPTRRGHLNAYPLEERRDLPGHGAIPWWNTWKSWPRTSQLIDAIRERFGDVVVQINHGRDKGLLEGAGWDRFTGVASNPDWWTPDFDAMEVMNDGATDGLDLDYMSLDARGVSVTPVAVSDSHGYRQGSGENITWTYTGTTLADFDDDALRRAFRARATVASRGPMLYATIDGAWAPGATVVGARDVRVEIFGASFVDVDTVTLWRDGNPVETRAAETGDILTFRLSDDQDGSWVITASGATPMRPVYDRTPWALTAAIRVDATGDGWRAPLPAPQGAR